MVEKQKTIYHKVYGEIHLRRKSGVRRMSVSVIPFKGIRVTVPYYLGFEEALKFLNEKESWVRKQMGKITRLEQSMTVFSVDTVFTTRNHGLILQRTADQELSGRIDNNSIRINIPDSAHMEDERIQQFIRKLIEESWRKEAKDYLPLRLQILANCHGFLYNRVSIRNNRSRWGSCSARNNINLNLHLMRLPGDLIDYVLLHELVHTRHKNHSREFWDKLESCIKDARQKDRELKKFRTDIY